MSKMNKWNLLVGPLTTQSIMKVLKNQKQLLKMYNY